MLIYQYSGFSFSLTKVTIVYITGDIGGFMGLLLGCSIISVVEILDHCMMCCWFAKSKPMKTRIGIN